MDDNNTTVTMAEGVSKTQTTMMNPTSTITTTSVANTSASTVSIPVASPTLLNECYYHGFLPRVCYIFVRLLLIFSFLGRRS